MSSRSPDLPVKLMTFLWLFAFVGSLHAQSTGGGVKRTILTDKQLLKPESSAQTNSTSSKMTVQNVDPKSLTLSTLSQTTSSEVMRTNPSLDDSMATSPLSSTSLIARSTSPVVLRSPRATSPHKHDSSGNETESITSPSPPTSESPKKQPVEKTTTDGQLDDVGEDEIREAMRRRKLRRRRKQQQALQAGTNQSQLIKPESTETTSTVGPQDDLSRKRKLVGPSSGNQLKKSLDEDEDYLDSDYESPNHGMKKQTSSHASNDTAKTPAQHDNDKVAGVDELDGRFNPKGIWKRPGNLSQSDGTRNKTARDQSTGVAKLGPAENGTIQFDFNWPANATRLNMTGGALDWSKLVKVVFKSSHDNQTVYTLVMNSSELSNHPISDWSNELPALLHRDFEKLIQKWSDILPMRKLVEDIGQIVVQRVSTIPSLSNSSTNSLNQTGYLGDSRWMAKNETTTKPFLMSNITANSNSSNVSTLSHDANSSSTERASPQHLSMTTTPRPFHVTSSIANSSTTESATRSLYDSRVNKTIPELLKEMNEDHIKLQDHAKEQASSLRHFIIICSVSVVLATSIVVFIIVLLFK